jgi:mRNA interferase MazF
MGAFTAGQIVVLPFPFSNLLQNKSALLLANVGQGDWLVCQITSKSHDKQAIEIGLSDFSSGNLQRISFARAGNTLPHMRVYFPVLQGN